MYKHPQQLHRAIALALTTGLATAACSKSTPELEQQSTSAHSNDFWSMQTLDDADTEALQHDVSEARSWACAAATNDDAWESVLLAAWPANPVAERCMNDGETDCWLWSFRRARGDEPQVHDMRNHAISTMSPVDTPADALYVAGLYGYKAQCDTLAQTSMGNWRMIASQREGDCPIMEYFYEVQIAPDATITVRKDLYSRSTNICVGRRPDGLQLATTHCDDAVGKHLAHIAWLEGAAVHAFERLVTDLEHHNAPAELIARAKRAIVDEIDHASRIGTLAKRYGGTIQDVQVTPHAERSLYDVALENAVEGCVRETYGVVDALYRSQHAQDPDVRAAFAVIAKDETRHAALSWDIAAWAETLLSADESAGISAAAMAAQDELGRQLGTGRPDVVRQQLGAPPAHAAVAMAQVLREGLAA
jgi:hypothetical protein